MNFRLIWMGHDDDPQDEPHRSGRFVSRSAAGGFPAYAQQGNEMVHRQLLQNGRVKITPVANFQARIVGDLVFDDGPLKWGELRSKQCWQPQVRLLDACGRVPPNGQGAQPTRTATDHLPRPATARPCLIAEFQFTPPVVAPRWPPSIVC
jgi:hypothetical protein